MVGTYIMNNIWDRISKSEKQRIIDDIKKKVDMGLIKCDLDNENSEIIRRRYKVKYGCGQGTTERMKRWMERNPEKVKLAGVKNNRNQVDKLTDNYIIHLLTFRSGLTRDDIRENPELIDTHRQLIKLKRAIKNIK